MATPIEGLNFKPSMGVATCTYVDTYMYGTQLTIAMYMHACLHDYILVLITLRLVFTNIHHVTLHNNLMFTS